MRDKKLSVIICTHNPRRDYLDRVLSALKVQTLECSEWELLIIDNASNVQVAEYLDISWHPAGRIVREEELGVGPARLRGVAEAQSRLVVFVDDDNVLEPDYLEKADAISDQYPFLGAWGAGKIVGEFETAPPSWLSPYRSHLALRTTSIDRWTNNVDDWPATPIGAGLCIRHNVAKRWREDANADPDRRQFGQKGAQLLRGEDIDIALSPRQFNLGWGVFTSLKITHLMPSNRMQLEYLCRLIEGSSLSQVVVNAKIGRSVPQFDRRVRRYYKLLRYFMGRNREHLLLYLAQQRGFTKGHSIIDSGFS
jgi:glycosyltransferase involved in cell wall biosynthesis